MVLYANNLLILIWANPTTVPIIKENKELINNKNLIVFNPKPSKTEAPVIWVNISKIKIKIEINK